VLHVAYGKCENNAKRKYCKLLKFTLELLESYGKKDSQFFDDIKSIACQVEFFND
jgi:hypothetical protein